MARRSVVRFRSTRIRQTSPVSEPKIFRADGLQAVPIDGLRRVAQTRIASKYRFPRCPDKRLRAGVRSIFHPL